MDSREDIVESEKAERRWLQAALLIANMYREIGTGGFAVDGQHVRRFHACYPFAMYALNHVIVAQRLIADRQHFTAQASTRIAFEHAVTAQWIMLTEGAEDLLLATLDRQQRKVLRDLARTATLPPELQAVLDNIEKKQEIPSFEQICDRFDSDKRVYALYRILSGSVHPSSATLAAMLIVKEDGSVGLNQRAVLPNRLDLTMTIGWSAVLAADVLETFRDGQPHLARVRKIAAQCQVPANLRHADVHPERQPPSGPFPAQVL